LYRSHINSIKYICSVSYILNKLKTLAVTEETVPLKENLAFLPSNRIGGGVRGRKIDPLIVSVFYTFIAERKLHVYILFCIYIL
jgi:hypothetical protein